MKKKDKKLIAAILIVVLLMIVIPLFALKGAEFGGSDDAGSQVVEEISGDYEPWFTPVLETLIDGELPGEVESLMFCVQTGIGVGIIAFLMGRFVERKKWEDKKQEN
ncbi:energy-coupling factor ABC transporter substrate-binding protein [Roseburia sp. MSJ-14]|uniref:energy-coupling factor ABC transporter substrate-binding protein n=1 Tax=Roseburia sp. MSJ-14 TaxID=2841514 RepID=UPI001C1062F5|nr:cobalt transport protein CbiN [Roseburia sp. MSJ-14]MBU5473028.1 cobalt transport protein CbiN [Roseburia sp. MSJ-14]